MGVMAMGVPTTMSSNVSIMVLPSWLDLLGVSTMRESFSGVS